jgi:triosephosphate isomerase
MRARFIAGNWKMHKTVGEAVGLVDALIKALTGERKKIMLAPPFTALSAVGARLRGTGILLGAQNCGPEEQGAHTGEVSVLMLKDVGVQVVILGHSERRHIYKEWDALINRKLRLAIRHGLEVVLCVGETQEQREAGITNRIVGQQLLSGLEGVTDEELTRITIAYEPVWAIGTGKTATPDDADEVHRFIRSQLAEKYSRQAGEDLVIQYGGSVKPGNATELMAMPNIDGFLVGGASLTADQFIPIVQFDRGR